MSNVPLPDWLFHDKYELSPSEMRFHVREYATAVSAADNAALRSALERTANALRLVYSQKPLRDMEETLAEADAALGSQP